MHRQFGYLFKVLYWLTDQNMNRGLAQMDLTASQGHIMMYLSHCEEPPCSKDIENVFRLSHATVSGLLSRLEKKDFIEFTADTADHRVKRILLRPKGYECLEQMRGIMETNESVLTKGFTPQETEEFASYLERSISNLNAELGYLECKKMGEEKI